MKSQLNRRGFLKLSAALSLLPILSTTSLGRAGTSPQSQPPNLIILLFDAMTALNLSLYGYRRETTPNLEKLAGRATVYHRHHSAGSFTTPSTASLFTGAYPWTHRAFALSSLVTKEVAPHNIFRLLADPYFEWAFGQNPHADILLYQFNEYIDRHEKMDLFSTIRNSPYNNFLSHDAIYGFKSFDDFLFKEDETHGSLFLSFFNDLNVSMRHAWLTSKLASIYPDGLPHPADVDVYFLTRQVFDGILGRMSHLTAPTFAYLHFFPPHGPYSPTRDFLGLFDDGWSPPAKVRHPLALRMSDQRLAAARREYDDYVANIDAELGRLFAHMEQVGLLDNSYIFITADHGELFERGTLGHFTPLMFEPVIHIPLIVFSPGQSQRKDVYDLTSNTDLAPTLFHLAGLPVPDWCEGQVLPGLGGESSPGRSVYSVDAKKNPSHAPIQKGTIALLKDDYKLVRYLGYNDYTGYEFYDLKNDPEELEDIYASNPLARDLQAELDAKLEQVNLPYLPPSQNP
jgi:arylsulfatase A-like enzyme